MSETDAVIEQEKTSHVEARAELEPRSPWQTLEKLVSVGDFSGSIEAKAPGLAAIAVGPNSHAGNDSSVAIGVYSNAYGTKTISIGARASGQSYSVIVGSESAASGHSSVVIGAFSSSPGAVGVAIGRDSYAGHDRSVALGSRSVTDKDNTVSVGSLEQRRAIRFVADGELAASSHEAVTGSQLFATNQKFDALQLLSEHISISEAGGPASATGNKAIAIGAESSSTGTHSTALGAATSANASWATAIGAGARVEGTLAIALGYVAQAKAIDSIAIGTDCLAEQAYAVVVGDHGVAASLAVALGSSAKATHSRAVALGAQSTTDKDNTISVGSVEQRRAIRFLADGELASSSHEAVTGRQLYATNQKVDANETAIATNADNISNAASQIKKLGDQVSQGSVGLVQQEGTSRKLTIGAATDGNLIDAAGSKGARRLTGLANGQDDSDAATCGQLTKAVKPLADGIASLGEEQRKQGEALSGLQSLSVQYEDTNKLRVELSGGDGTVVANVADGVKLKDAVNKGQLDVVDRKVTQLTNDLGNLNNRFIDLESLAVSSKRSGVSPALK